MKSVDSEFIRIMAPAVECFGKEMSAALWGIYCQSLSDLDPERLRLAVARAVRELKFFPKPAELRDLAENSLTLGDRAEVALSVVRRAAREIQDAYSITFPTPINAVIEQMGGRQKVFSWEHIGKGWTYEQRAEFLALYRAFVQSGETGPERLPGNFELWAQRNGHPLPGVMSLGLTFPCLIHIGSNSTGERPALPEICQQLAEEAVQ